MTDGWPFQSPLGGMDADTWDAMAGDRLYSSSRWLEYCGTDPRNAAGAVHVRSEDGRGGGTDVTVPVAAIVAEPNPFYRWEQELSGRGLPSPAASGVLVGPHRGYQTDLLSSGDPLSGSSLAALLTRLRELPAEAAEAGLLGDRPPSAPPCMAMYLATADVRRFQQAGVATTPLLLKADAWIPIPRDGWAGWLDALPKRRPTVVRREIDQFARAGYTVEDTTLARCSEIAGRLISLTEARYGHSTPAEQHAANLARQAAAMGASARVLLCRRGHEVVGYSCYYLSGDVLYLRSVGFDHARLVGAAEYFNLAYYLLIRIAGEAGARWLHAGIEGTEAKALRGAELRPLWLLDLSERSPLLGHEAETERHNARMSAELAAGSAAIAKAMTEPDDGLPSWGWGCAPSALLS